ncbi:MAG: hypothetical protein M1505_02625 [Patescibacteria group bacterium]|nr:hypothetical protein [Patescibacteria group bacterium]
MRKIKNVFIVFGAIILITFTFLMVEEIIKKPPIQTSYQINGTGQKVYKISNNELGPNFKSTPINTINATTAPAVGAIGPVFQEPLGFAKIDYPKIYAYDYQSKTVTAFDLEHKTFQQLYDDPNISFLSLSPDKQSLLIKSSRGVIDHYFVLDITADNLTKLNLLTRAAGWIGNLPLYYVSNEGNINYIAELNRQGVEKKLFNFSLLEPEFFSPDGQEVIFYDKPQTGRASPLFLYDPSQSLIKEIFQAEPGLTAIGQKNSNLIFISYFSQSSWISNLIDFGGKIQKAFNFGTFADSKCSFEQYLVCGVPTNQNLTGLPENWLQLKKSFTDKIFIYNPNDNKEKTIDLNGNYDVLKPQLTQAGLFFTNRLDRKLYFMPMKNFSL